MEVMTYRMLPHACARGDVPSCRIPLDVSDTVVFGRGHELQVCREIFVFLLLLALEIEVPEVEFEGLLRVNRSDDNKAALGTPVDRIAVLAVDGTDMLEVANRIALCFLWTEE